MKEWEPEKKITCGMVLFLLGLLWYLNDTGMIKIEPFWPTMLILFGAFMVFRGIYTKYYSRKKGKKR